MKSDSRQRHGLPAASHAPASILHHLVFLPNSSESMRFLIDRGIDMTIKDNRWDVNAVGWARYG